MWWRGRSSAGRGARASRRLWPASSVRAHARTPRSPCEASLHLTGVALFTSCGQDQHKDSGLFRADTGFTTYSGGLGRNCMFPRSACVMLRGGQEGECLLPSSGPLPTKPTNKKVQSGRTQLPRQQHARWGPGGPGAGASVCGRPSTAAAVSLLPEGNVTLSHTGGSRTGYAAGQGADSWRQGRA